MLIFAGSLDRVIARRNDEAIQSLECLIQSFDPVRRYSESAAFLVPAHSELAPPAITVLGGAAMYWGLRGGRMVAGGRLELPACGL